MGMMIEILSFSSFNYIPYLGFFDNEDEDYIREQLYSQMLGWTE
jgi:hypothetical protein